ncbi:MAG: DUF6573 family protein [Candidatus Lutacidiplasmatales archaeon]
MGANEAEPFGSVIYGYSRAQGIDDGFLVDAGPMAKKAGLSLPTVLTRSVWNRCVEVPKGLEGEQDEMGRLWDVLYLASFALRMAAVAGKTGDRLTFSLHVRDADRKLREVSVVAHVGPGDAGEPVLTLMFPEDD